MRQIPKLLSNVQQVDWIQLPQRRFSGFAEAID
jgi:hypothetical protein